MSQAITLLDIEHKRCEDFFYGVFFNDTVQNNVYFTVMEILEKSFRKQTISNRLNVTMQRLKSQTITPPIKHALIFFAIFLEPEVQDYVLCSIRNPVRKNEVKAFFQTELAGITNKILNGQLSCLTHYVDAVRNAVSVNIGFE